MIGARRPWRACLLASAGFHLAFCAVAWRVRVPVAAVTAPRLAVYFLPTLRAAPATDTPMPEPQFQPQPVQRPYLRPPAPQRNAAALLPGPFPHEDAAVAALLAEPVMPGLLDARALGSGLDYEPLPPRETPPPYLD